MGCHAIWRRSSCFNLFIVDVNKVVVISLQEFLLQVFKGLRLLELSISLRDHTSRLFCEREQPLGILLESFLVFALLFKRRSAFGQVRKSLS